VERERDGVTEPLRRETENRRVGGAFEARRRRAAKTMCNETRNRLGTCRYFRSIRGGFARNACAARVPSLPSRSGSRSIRRNPEESERSDAGAERFRSFNGNNRLLALDKALVRKPLGRK